MLNALAIVGGISLLVAGGEILVRHASILAHRAGISTLVVGLTVVAFGTSAPELAVNTMAALKGNGGISFGNIVGSNIANIGLILGIAASARALSISRHVIDVEMPRMIVISVVFSIMAFGGSLNRLDGLALLALFAYYIFLMYGESVKGMREQKETSRASKHKVANHVLARSAVLVVAGLAALWAGGELTVYAAIALAHSIGVPESVIALSIIAIGTSLPELVVSTIATIKGETSLAIGNIVGSNIFNLLLVGGVSSSIAPFEVPTDGGIDLAVMLVLSVTLIIMSKTHQRRILRTEGLALLVFYALFIAFRFARHL